MAAELTHINIWISQPYLCVHASHDLSHVGGAFHFSRKNRNRKGYWRTVAGVCSPQVRPLSILPKEPSTLTWQYC